MRTRIRVLSATLAIAGVACMATPSPAASAREIDRQARAALQTLSANVPKAKELAAKAKGILVFPKIVKGGFIVGGQFGDGALIKKGKTAGYYRSVAASYGLQAGLQWFGYALMFMDDESLAYLDKSDGWEVGVGPTIVVVDKGKAKTLTTTTLQSGIYAFIFSQKGLMGGLGVQGSKITRIHPD